MYIPYKSEYIKMAQSVLQSRTLSVEVDPISHLTLEVNLYSSCSLPFLLNPRPDLSLEDLWFSRISFRITELLLNLSLALDFSIFLLRLTTSIFSWQHEFSLSINCSFNVPIVALTYSSCVLKLIIFSLIFLSSSELIASSFEGFCNNSFK